MISINLLDREMLDGFGISPDEELLSFTILTILILIAFLQLNLVLNFDAVVLLLSLLVLRGLGAAPGHLLQFLVRQQPHLMLYHQFCFHGVECDVGSFDLLSKGIFSKLLCINLIILIQLRFLHYHRLLVFVGLNTLLHFLDALGQFLLAQLFVLFFGFRDSALFEGIMRCL
jgi:hypothetical protein